MAEGLTVMIIGSGAREDTIAKAYGRSPRVERIVVAPGNDFMPFKSEKISIEKKCDLKKPETFLEIAKVHKPDIVDVAQDDALAAGTVDMMRANGFRAFGPTKAAARIEWDKRWSREFMAGQKIPTPRFAYYEAEEPAIEYVKGLYTMEPQKVVYVKAAGLCAGKGALKATSFESAVEKIKKMKSFGEAGKTFLIEDGLIGEEFSCYAITDGEDYHIFKSAQDNKTVFNFDEGDQTGGMGAISPAMVTGPISKQIEETLISRAIGGMASKGTPYQGVLYLGGMLTEGGPMNVEYNARWGDPECQAVLPSVKTDYAEIVMACLDGKLKSVHIEEDDKTRVCVAGASRGYPNDYSKVKGKRIYGLEEAMETENVTVLGAGIEVKDGNFRAAGGRLVSVVGEGRNIIEARHNAYSAMALISVEGNNLHYRTDIGWRDVERFLTSSR